MNKIPRISIIIPFYNEEGCVEKVLSELQNVRPEDHIIAVNDGSTDTTYKKLLECEKLNPLLTVLSLDKNMGQSAAIWKGLTYTKSEICVLMDGDGECNPADIQKLIDALETADFACGYRVSRERSKWNIFSSRFSNLIRRIVTKDGVRDTGAMKVILTEHVQHIKYFPGMHRFIPALLKNAGLNSREIPIYGRQRIAGETKYTSYKRAFQGMCDLVIIKKLLKT